MGLIEFFKSLFAEPEVTLISFRCDGCMATDWHEVDRGVIIGRVTRDIPGGGRDGVEYIVARRPDGSTFESYAGYCMPGAAYMQDRTDNPEEDLTDKWVYLN